MEKEVEANERVLSVKVKKEVEKAVNEVFCSRDLLRISIRCMADKPIKTYVCALPVAVRLCLKITLL